MSWGSPGFVIAIIAMSMVGWMVTTWLRAKHGYPVENEWGGTVHRTAPDADRKIALLTDDNAKLADKIRSEEHTSELQSLMRISYAVFCLKKKTQNQTDTNDTINY